MERQVVGASGERLCFLFLLILSNATCSEVTVTLSTGNVAGLKLVSAVNRVYYSFQGIPYAAPPVGYLRFKPPLPPQKWNGTLKAFYAAPACAQPWRKVQFPEKYSEDCLYINVFTPYLQPPEGAPLAVMVWVHGGQHYGGSSSRYKYGADFLLTGGVVVVTFDYRLGVFGYLNMNTRSAQGNAGLKDMVAALRWVQKEIGHFGGDPNKVTIFGGSSGGQDVNCLYLSPLSQGLFHRAISQSGQSCGEVNSADTVASSRALARRLGCDGVGGGGGGGGAEETVDCLRGVTAQALAEAQMEVVTPRPGEVRSPFLPDVEQDCGEEVVLPVAPPELLTSSTATVPYLLGFNSGEGLMHLEDPTENPNQFSNFEKHFEEYLPFYIKQRSTEKSLQYIVKTLKEFYFNNTNVTMDTIENYINFMTDKQYTYDIVQTAKSLSTHAPVYLYLFAFRGAFEEPYKPAEGLNLTMVGHGKELGYLFFRNALIEAHNHMSEFPLECEVVTKMVRLWTNFAKYGNPTPDKDDPLLNTTWLPVTSDTTRHLVIGRTLVTNTSSLYPDRVAVWAEVYRMADQGAVEAEWGIAIAIIAAVSVLSLMSLTFLLWDCCCRRRDPYMELD